MKLTLPTPFVAAYNKAEKASYGEDKVALQMQWDMTAKKISEAQKEMDRLSSMMDEILKSQRTLQGDEHE